ncbi:uncharacterized protein LOC128961400 [Oppia nitens]|uniref:uncharacterized protein LOC128961400 n=1 Tax=Oppia nitens TaxID=1686743 RepID=UPI0023D9CA32|nr:uncharacterized protein LOC128961400 [Oppia nitens]
MSGLSVSVDKVGAKHLKIETLNDINDDIPVTETKLNLSVGSSRVICFTICILFVTILILLGLAIRSAFVSLNSISMDRSSYWWLFLYSLFTILYLKQTAGLLYSSHSSSRFMSCLILSTAMTTIDMILLTRYLIVTFPFREINWRPEPIVLIVTHFVQLIVYIAVTVSLTNYAIAES